ncbi:hypothetical protein AQ1_01955 [alpha proteobacterium Q-1]|nr:hypothetical protein AQ1_01955 [alpha proteobacterium Q-1]
MDHGIGTSGIKSRGFGAVCCLVFFLAGCATDSMRVTDDQIGLYRPNLAADQAVDAAGISADQGGQGGTQPGQRLMSFDAALRDINQRLGGSEAVPAEDIAQLKADQRGLLARIDDLQAQLAEQTGLMNSLIIRLAEVEKSLEAQIAKDNEIRNAANRAEAEKARADGVDLAVGTGQLYAVHLASYRDAKAASEGWADLSNKYPALLSGLSPRLSVLDLEQMGGRFYRLVAGPFKEIAPARVLCSSLRESGAFCQLSNFDGEPL